MKQYEAVIETLDKLGGVATLGELNREVFKISDCEWKTKTPFASIRRIVQQTKGIYKIKPGLYGLEKYRKQIEDRGIIVETEKNKDSNDVIMFNHTYYQGILLIIGKYRNMQTFVPKHNATYSFTNNALTAQAGSGTINITWSSPNAMSVYSNYTYLLPQTSASVTIKLNLTIGNKPFSNRSTTLSEVTLNANNTYYNNVSFTTTEGYIIGGNIWANGNLYYTAETKKYGIYPNTLTCSKANNAPDYFVFNNPLPNNPELVTTWSDSRDPCRKVEPNSTWRTPTLQEFNNLLSYAKGVPKDGYTIYGDVLKLPYSSFMRFTDGHPHEPYFDAIGYYLCTTYNRHLQNEFIAGVRS
jgi:hypothetical protein